MVTWDSVVSKVGLCTAPFVIHVLTYTTLSTSLRATGSEDYFFENIVFFPNQGAAQGHLDFYGFQIRKQELKKGCMTNRESITAG